MMQNLSKLGQPFVKHWHAMHARVIFLDGKVERDTKWLTSAFLQKKKSIYSQNTQMKNIVLKISQINPTHVY